MKNTLALILLFLTCKLGFAQTTEFNPQIRFKNLPNNQVRIRILPRDYFEFKAIGNAGIKITITPISTKNGLIANPAGRVMLFDTFTRAQWKSKALSPELIAVSQLVQGKIFNIGNTFSEQIINAQKMQENIYFLAFLGAGFSWDAAEMSRTGMEFNLHKDTVYNLTFELLRYSNLIQNKKIDVAYSHSSIREFEVPVLATTGLEKQVSLKWPKYGDYLAYHVYDYDLKEKNGNKLTSRPYTQLSIDSITGNIEYKIEVENYKPRKYRIAAFDIFGDSTHFSDFVVGYGRDRTPPLPIENGVGVSNSENHARISWGVSNDADRVAIEVHYSNQNNGPFQLLKVLKPQDTVFTTNNASNVRSNFYLILAKDTAGNLAYFPPINVVTFDTVPASNPNIINATLNDSGQLKLVWNSVKDEDIKGYRIGVSNKSNGNVVNLSPFEQIDTTFQDQLEIKKMTGELYYFVVSQDLKGNIARYNKPILVKIPDLIPPSIATIESFVPGEKGNMIIKIKLPNQSDAVKLEYRIITNQKDTSHWQEHVLAPQLLVEGLSAKNSYAIELRTIDASNNRSEITRSVENGPLPKKLSSEGVKLLVAIQGNNAVKITWSGAGKEITHMKLYKKTGSGPYYNLGKLSISEKEHIERGIAKYTLYQFAIQLVDKDGNVSDYIESNTVFIK